MLSTDREYVGNHPKDHFFIGVRKFQKISRKTFHRNTYFTSFRGFAYITCPTLSEETHFLLQPGPEALVFPISVDFCSRNEPFPLKIII